MSSSSPASHAAIVGMYQSVMTTDSIEVAVTTLLLYDFLVCFDKEVRYVWKTSQRSRMLSRALYLFVRYMVLLFNIIGIAYMLPLSTRSCTITSWFIEILEVFSLLGPSALTTLRVYALSGGNKLVTGVTMLLSTAPFVVNVSTLYQLMIIDIPEPPICGADRVATRSLAIGLVIAARVSVVLADTLAIAVTWRRTYLMNRLSTDVLRQSSLERMLWENGNVYFCAVASLNIIDIILATLSIANQLEGGGSYITAFVDPISIIFTCRFLLALYETNDALERGGPSVSSVSLRFNAAGRTASPSLPEFLNPLAGPIHSISDDDSDSEPYEQEMVPQTEDEAEAEVNALGLGAAAVDQTDTQGTKEEAQVEASSIGRPEEVERQV